MPSLAGLEKFKLLFNELGGEIEWNLKNGLTREEYPVPPNEPLPLDDAAAQAGGAATRPQADDAAARAEGAAARPQADDAAARPQTESAAARAQAGGTAARPQAEGTAGRPQAEGAAARAQTDGAAARAGGAAGRPQAEGAVGRPQAEGAAARAQTGGAAAQAGGTGGRPQADDTAARAQTDGAAAQAGGVGGRPQADDAAARAEGADGRAQADGAAAQTDGAGEADEGGAGFDISFGDFTARPPEELMPPELPDIPAPSGEDGGLDQSGLDLGVEAPADGLDLGGLDLGTGAPAADGPGQSGLDLGAGAPADGGLDQSGLDLGADAPADGGLDLSGLDLGAGAPADGPDLSGLDLGAEAPADGPGQSGLDLGAGAPADGGLDLGADAPADGGLDLSGLDLGADAPADGPDLSGLDLGADAPADGPDLSGLDLGADAPADGGLDLSGLDLGAGAPADGLDLSGLDLGAGAPADGLDLSGLDLGADAPADGGPDQSGLDLGTDAPADGPDLSGLDLGGMDVGGGVAGAEVPAADAFDDFSIEELRPDDGAALPALDDLGITGLDAPPAAKAAAKKSDDAELSAEDMERLLRTLDGYPLNLRLACEELIAAKERPDTQTAKLIQLLVNEGSAREAADLAGRISKKIINLPRGARKKAGEQLEAEQKSLSAVFVRKFLPVITLGLIALILSACVSYLAYQFIYKPVSAGRLYARGYERIAAGEYERANEYFSRAFERHPVKSWFYRYAEAFRDEKQYRYAEEKYEQLFAFAPRDKKGSLDYARMESADLRAYEKADDIIRKRVLDFKPDDRDALLALGDVNLDWGDSDPERYAARYEQARLAYARYAEVYGRFPEVMERMLRYFIRVDNLDEVIPIQKSFMADPGRKIPAALLAELGGYLLDKRLETPAGVVPDAAVGHIEGVKDVLIRAATSDDEARAATFKRTGVAPPRLPEPHYQLGRYYHFYHEPLNERHTLETAAEAFDAATLETPARARARIETQRLLAALMIKNKEFFAAEEALAKGVNLYEDALERRLLRKREPRAGMLYAALGDIEYFINNADIAAAVRYYLDAERNGYLPPETEYRLGAAYYYLENYPAALERFFNVSMKSPYNRRLLFAQGNVAYLRNDFFAAQGYFQRLIRDLESDRRRFPDPLPDDRPDHRELLERLMLARNNMGVTLSALAGRAGRPLYRTQALAMFSEAERYWDILSRGKSMIRPGISDAGRPGRNLPNLNFQHTLYPLSDGQSILYIDIDKDLFDNSEWEALAAKSVAGIAAAAREESGGF